MGIDKENEAKIETMERENERLKLLVDRSLSGISWIRQQALKIRIQNANLNTYIYKLQTINNKMKRSSIEKEFELRIARRETNVIYELMYAKDEEIDAKTALIENMKKEHTEELESLKEKLKRS